MKIADNCSSTYKQVLNLFINRQCYDWIPVLSFQ